MTPPIIASSQPKVTYNAGLLAGVKKYGIDTVPMFGAKAGAKIEYKGFHAGADVTAGTATGYNIEIGKEFDINKTWGLELSASTSYTASMLSKSQNEITHQIPIEDGVLRNNAKTQWRPGILSTDVKAMANYTSNNNKFNLSIGVSEQYIKNNAANVSLLTHAENADGNSKPEFTSVKSHKEGFMASPEVQIGYKISDKIALGLNANALGGSAGISYTF